MAKSDKDAQAYDFVTGFVSHSKDYKSQYIEKWQEVLANFMVDPQEFSSDSISRPYVKGERRHVHQSRGIVLKDAETHKAIMTYASNLVLSILGDRRGEFVRASPVGWEDAGPKSDTVTRLMRYAFNLPGHFRTMVEAVIDMLLFGTSILEINWKYLEREQLVRTVSSIDGVIEDDTVRQRVVAYDDPAIIVVDNQDFFPDPSEYRIENMNGVAKRFKINKLRATELSDGGFYREKATDRAISNMGGSGTDQSGSDFRRGIDQPEDTEEYKDFQPMVGFEYWGEVPWEDERGSSRRVITLLENEVVRDIPYPLADTELPFKSLVINPVVGRFYGVSPAEVIRWDQSLQDAVKILLAEAIIRQVHPPITYDIDSEIDLNKLRRWTPDVPIGVRGGPNSIGTLQYGANVFNGFAEANALKQSMQEASGALQVVQGGGLSNSRASASEAQFTQQQAMNRPQLGAALLERDAMPQIAKALLRRYQQFLDDNEDLRLRVGEMPESVWIGDIMGDFDIQFVGSRLDISRQEKLQQYDRLVALSGAIPQAQMMIPWQLLLRDLIGKQMDLPEVAAKMADPQVMQQNILLQQMTGQGGAGGNGVPQRSSPAGQLPAAASGGIGG